MDYINLTALTNLIKRLPRGNSLTSSFNSIKQDYSIGIKSMKPQLVLSLAKRINQRQKTHEQHQKLSWAFGELKVFNCIAIFQSIANDKKIREFTEVEISQINSIFSSKSKLFIQYQIKVLANLRQTSLKVWTEEELAYLSDSVDEDNKASQAHQYEDKINWKAVSFRLFQRSDGRYFHNLNHCREMWNNHLDPRVKKQQWSIDEDIQLFSLVIQFGTKWSKIAKSFNHTRTEHMVKNRYNRFFKLWKKNSDFEREASLDVIQLKFSKAHLKRLEAKRGSTGSEQSFDAVKNVNQDESLKLDISEEAIEQEQSIQYEQIHHSESKENKPQMSKVGQKVLSQKSEQGRMEEFLKLQEQCFQSDQQPYKLHQQTHRQNSQITPQKPQPQSQQYQQQQWLYYPFLQLYLPRGMPVYFPFL